MSILNLIKTANPGDIIFDKGESQSVKGLHLRCFPSGNKAFYLSYRSNLGTRRNPKICDYPTLTLTQARDAARALLSEVAKGEDPSQKRKQSRAEKTVSELYKDVYRSLWSKDRFQESGWAKEVDILWTAHLEKTFGKYKVSELTRGDVMDWYEMLSEKSIYAANRSLSVLGRVYSYAERREWVPIGMNPCAKLEKVKEAKRSRFASETEISKIKEILTREFTRRPKAVAFLYLLMFTGARPRSIERARWDELTVMQHEGETIGLLRFHGKTTSDSGKLEEVVIPPEGMAFISKLIRDSEYLIGIKLPRGFWDEVKKEAGCEDLWARDFRRTYATVALSSGESADGIGELQNHKSAQTRLVYQKLTDTAKLSLAIKIGKQISAIGSKIQN